MNFLGIGTQEILIIAVAALLIFGPNRLPEVAGQAGRWIRDLRKMSSDLMGDIEGQAGVREFKSAIESEIKGVKSELNKATSGVNREIAGVTKSANDAVAATNSAIKGSSSRPTAKASTSTVPKAKTATTTTAKTGTAAKAATPKKPVATKVEPQTNASLLAEVTPKRPRSIASVETATAATESAPPATADALARMRERRSSAGYNRSLAS